MAAPSASASSAAILAENTPLVKSSTVPLQAGFSGHETFAFRYTWLKKGVDGLTADPDIFRKDQAIVTLGVGKNMVSSIRYWGTATRVFTEGDAAPGGRLRPLSVSAFGTRLFGEPDGWDPFLEDDASLWLLHWNLATNSARATTWYWAFNLLREQEFTRDALAEILARLIETRGWNRVSPATLKSDLSCFLRTYLPGRRGVTSTPEETLDCPLATLGLLVAAEDTGRRLRFNNKPKPTLTPAVFCYALLEFWQSRHGMQNTLSLREIVHGEGSPGRVFRLDEDATLFYLDTLSSLTKDGLRFDDTALVRQVVKRGETDPYLILDDYYKAR